MFSLLNFKQYYNSSWKNLAFHQKSQTLFGLVTQSFHCTLSSKSYSSRSSRNASPRQIIALRPKQQVEIREFFRLTTCGVELRLNYLPLFVYSYVFFFNLSLQQLMGQLNDHINGHISPTSLCSNRGKVSVNSVNHNLKFTTKKTLCYS